jgi:predicted Zn-dependent protease
VALAAALIASALWALVPRVGQLIGRGKPDALSLAYLRLLTSVRGDDAPLRLRFARTLLDAGAWAEAEDASAPLLRDGIPEARALRAACEVARAREKLPGSAGRREAEAAAVAEIGALLASCRAARKGCEALSELPALALELSRPRLAGEIEELRADLEPARRGERLAAAAAAFSQADEPGRAGELFAQAALSLGGEEGVRHALRALSLLRGARDRSDALSLARALVARFPEQRGLLDAAIQLALAREALDDARAFAARALALDGEDRAALCRSLELTLAVGRPREALPLARRLVALEPESAEARRTLAQVAEWADHPLLSLAQWRWLDERGSEGAARGTLRLAREVHSPADVVRVLARVGRARRLSNAELKELSEALANLVDAPTAGAVLQGILAAHPGDRRLWELLVRAREQGGDLTQALALLEEIEQRFGPSAELTVAQAELLWRFERPREALARLRQRAEAAAPPDSAVAFWQLYSELAWREEAQQDALRAHEALFRIGALDATGFERLLLLLHDAGKASAILSAARVSWEKLREARLLLVAADAMAQADRLDDAAALLALGGPDGAGGLAGYGLYWILRGEILRREGHAGPAREAFLRALALDPRSAPARLGLLTLAIAGGDAKVLAETLARFAEDAEGDPALAAGFALGFDRLGQLDKALRFYEIRARQEPGDVLWILAWADALDRGHRPEAALRLRWHAARRLPLLARAAAPGQSPARRAEVLLRSMALLQSVRGAGATAAWLRLQLNPASAASAPGGEDAPAVRSGSTEGSSEARIADRLAEGREGEALALLLARLPALQPDASSSRRSEVSLRGAWSKWGSLSLAETEATAVWQAFRGLALDLHLGLEELDDATLPGAPRAIDRRLAVGLALDSGGDRVSLHAGLDLRDAGPASPGGGASGRAGALLLHRLPHGFTARLEGELREDADDTAALRLLGRRDRLGAGLLYTADERTSASLQLGLRRTYLRDGTALSPGWSAAADAQRSLLLGNPGVRLRAQGLLVRNGLPSGDPAELGGYPLTLLLAPRFAEAGLGIASELALSPSVRVSGDAFSGWSWPTDQLALRLQLDLAVKLFRKEELRVGGSYASGGVLRESSISVFAAFVHGFGP